MCSFQREDDFVLDAGGTNSGRGRVDRGTPIAVHWNVWLSRWLPTKPQSRRHSGEDRAASVLTVRTLRAEPAAGHDTVERVAARRVHWVQSVRQWITPAEIDDGPRPG
jgi:hypothetical protein